MAFGLNANMIPRRVRRLFDQRAEPRRVPDDMVAVLGWRGRTAMVTIGNVSRAGAMVLIAEPLRIGERVTLQMLDRPVIEGEVRWLRDGCAGINFAPYLD